MESISNDFMLFSLEADDKKVWSLPSQGFLEVLIQSSEMFFVRMNHILLNKIDFKKFIHLKKFIKLII